jgi:hypothetical protein
MKVDGDMYIYLNIMDNMCPPWFPVSVYNTTTRLQTPNYHYIRAFVTMSQINLSRIFWQAIDSWRHEGKSGKRAYAPCAGRPGLPVPSLIRCVRIA